MNMNCGPEICLTPSISEDLDLCITFLCCMELCKRQSWTYLSWPTSSIERRDWLATSSRSVITSLSLQTPIHENIAGEIVFRIHTDPHNLNGFKEMNTAAKLEPPSAWASSIFNVHVPPIRWLLVHFHVESMAVLLVSLGHGETDCPYRSRAS